MLRDGEGHLWRGNNKISLSIFNSWNYKQFYWIGKPNISSTLLRLLYNHDDYPSYQGATSKLHFKLYFLNNPFHKKRGIPGKNKTVQISTSQKSIVLDAPLQLFSSL